MKAVVQRTEVRVLDGVTEEDAKKVEEGDEETINRIVEEALVGGRSTWVSNDLVEIVPDEEVEGGYSLTSAPPVEPDNIDEKKEM